MKKYKQWLALLLCAAIFCLLAGCGDDSLPPVSSSSLPDVSSDVSSALEDTSSAAEVSSDVAQVSSDATVPSTAASTPSSPPSNSTPSSTSTSSSPTPSSIYPTYAFDSYQGWESGNLPPELDTSYTFETQAQLNDYISSFLQTYGERSLSIQLLEAVARYDDSYFQDHVLVVGLCQNHPPVDFITSAIEEGTLKIDVQFPSMLPDGAVMVIPEHALWHVLVEIPKSDIQGPLTVEFI